MAYCEPVDGSDDVVLVLTRAEANAIRALTGAVKGPLEHSPRKLLNNIWRAVKPYTSAGVSTAMRSLLDPRPEFKAYTPGVPLHWRQ